MQFGRSSTRTVRDNVVTNASGGSFCETSVPRIAPDLLLELEDLRRLVLGDVNTVLHIEDLLAQNLLIGLLNVRLIDND